MRIGVDLGGTKIAAGIIDHQGNVVRRKRIQTECCLGYETVRDHIVRLIEDLIDESGVDRGQVTRIGIAAAGQIATDRNSIIFSPNLGWHDAPLRPDVERLCNIPTTIENDVNAATYGEWRFALKGVPADVLGIFVGTGIGGGIIIDRKLYRGFAGVGAEVGHITLNPLGYQCRCGNTGCFEAYCGGSYILERVRKRIDEGYQGKLLGIIDNDCDSMNSGHIEEGCLMGDELCVAIWGEVIEYMGAGLASLVNLLNPEVVILGGGVVLGSRYLLLEAIRAMERRAMSASLVNMQIEQASLGDDAAILGAAFVDE